MKNNLYSVNKTLYIPLYGKAYVSRRSLFINDGWAERIWEAEGFPIKGKSKSKWLAYYMGIRSAVFDDWVKEKLTETDDAVVLHIGCGMDSRAFRIGDCQHPWYDLDFPEVIAERKKYYSESEHYKMLGCDLRSIDWLSDLPCGRAIVLMEGVSMYLSPEELRAALDRITDHFASTSLLIDCYTPLAARLSKYKNPINDVGVRTVWGIDDPKLLESERLKFATEQNMTPKEYINELHGLEKFVFSRLYAGGFSKKLYRLFAYETL